MVTYDVTRHMSKVQTSHLMFESVMNFLYVVYSYQHMGRSSGQTDTQAFVVSIVCNMMSALTSDTVRRNVLGITDHDITSSYYFVTVVRDALMTAMWSVSLESLMASNVERMRYCVKGKRIDGSACNPMDQLSLFGLLAVQVMSITFSRLITGLLDHVHVMITDDRYQKDS